MQYPRLLCLVTKIEAVDDNARIEVKKFDIPEGEVTIKPNGDIVVYNDYWKTITTITKAEAINDTYSKVFGSISEKKELLSKWKVHDSTPQSPTKSEDSNTKGNTHPSLITVIHK